MAMNTPKSESVTEEGVADGWTNPAGYRREMDHSGKTRITVSTPLDQTVDIHAQLLDTLAEPISFLYRQVVDRVKVASGETPPQGLPPRDFVALELTRNRVKAALRTHADLIYHDARCEVWLKGRLGEQIVLDADGVIYTYPDDPVFTDVLDEAGYPDSLVQSILERDYAKHWFHPQNDLLETSLISFLKLAEVPPR